MTRARSSTSPRPSAPRSTPFSPARPGRCGSSPRCARPWRCGARRSRQQERMVAHEPLHLSMRIEPIDDPADPRVADYRDIKDAELRRRRGLFVAESRAVVRALLASARFRTRSVLLTAPALHSLSDVLPGTEVPVYLASHEVARAVLGFDFHRGCVALGERGDEPALD